MKEIQDIVRAYEVVRQEGGKAALATVVHVQGSSYRRPGARMLVTEDGQLTGAISGGCLEGDALRKARLVILKQQPMLVTYDTTDEDDTTLGVGLGCNGIIRILIEPLDPENETNPVRLLEHFLSKRQTAVLVTHFSFDDRKLPEAGTRLLLTAEGLSGSMPPASDRMLQEKLKTAAQKVLQDGASAMQTYAEAGAATLTGFLQFLQPAVSLVLVGAGNDALPLVQLAHVLGWQVTVVDGRANYATTARFPLAHRVLVAKPEQALPQLQVDGQTVFVLMTHNYTYDLAMLRQLLPLGLPYIGSLGPEKKLQRMLEELQDAEGPIPVQQLQSVYGPVGLDIGAETAEEIALSIIAEIKAVLAGKDGISLRRKSGEIHPREEALLQQQESPALYKLRGCSL
ncbi:XdhC family protein [Pontibacter chitinilyticus]|uniref:XdhC family protein n=1 Tax=Pontibacter chitinilyticus TaxID=2674989 RepID=UPI00321B9D1B